MIEPANDENCYDLEGIELPGIKLVINEEECFLEVKEHHFPIYSTTDFKLFNKVYTLSNGEYELTIPPEQFEILKPLLPF